MHEKKRAQFLQKKKKNSGICDSGDFLLGRRMCSGICHWLHSCFLFYDKADLCRTGNGTINSGDSVLVNRFTYLVSAPKPGDVVVFKPNGNERSHYYMRRVIAEPGDKVQIKDGFVYVNGELFETGLGSEQMDYAGVAEEEITIGDGEYFVLGDNRNQSEDSRNADIGNVKKEDIYGKAWFVCLPWENFGPIPKGHS